MSIQYVTEVSQTELSKPEALVLSLYGVADESPLLYLLAALKASLYEKPRSTKVNLAVSALDSAFMAVAAQDPLWRQASARLSGDMADYSMFTSQRVEEALKLPALLAKVLDQMPELTLVIFEGAVGCSNIKQYLAPLEKALRTCKKPPTVIVSQV